MGRRHKNDAQDAPAAAQADGADPDATAATDEAAAGDADAPATKPSLKGYGRLYSFATAGDKLLMVVGVLAAMVHGATLPAFSVVFGDIINDFDGNESDLSDAVADSAALLTYFGVISFVSGFLQVWTFSRSSINQGLRIRKAYVEALLRQDVAFYDNSDTGVLSSRIIADTAKIQNGMGDKVTSFVQFATMFLGGIGLGLYYGWKMTLVLLSVAPLLAFSGALFSKFVAEAATKGQEHYSGASGVADEAFALLRTVVAFNMQEHEARRYESQLVNAKTSAIKSAFTQGIGLGITMGIIFGSYALSFWYGSQLIDDGDMNAGDVTTVFFSVMIGAMAIGNAAPAMTAMAEAAGAGKAIYDEIDRESQIDSLSDEGERPDKVVGDICFRDVHFHYPTRPDETVFRGLNLTVKAGSTVALVGESGCGKSTVVSLLERFYNLDSGSITLDGRDIKDINVQWLRSNMSLVQQTPVLFPTTVGRNIALGKRGATQAEIEAAATLANAHDFIMGLPDGYDTMVGDAGSQLSGGQRQRVAIARSLISNPAIILLDEATSALDTESEGVVQEALDAASKDRTTLVIAHRLSTIENADVICVIGNGGVVEQGTHDELMAKHGLYYSMQQLQTHGAAAKGRRASKETSQANGARASAAASTLMGAIDGMKEADDKEGDKDDAKEKKEDEEEEEDIPEPPVNMIRWALRKSKGAHLPLVIGGFCALVEGAMWPAFSIAFAQMIDVLVTTNDQHDVRIWTGVFCAIAVGAFIAVFGKVYGIKIASEHLTYKLRSESFRAVILNPIGWHDDSAHGKGIITSRLANDAADVHSVLGDSLGVILSLVGAVLGGVVVAMVYCWQIGLIILATLPFIAAASSVQMKMMVGFSDSKELEASAKFASEAIEHIRTVLALGQVYNFLDQFVLLLQKPVSKMMKAAWVQAFFFGLSEFSLFGVWALAFYVGSVFVDKNSCTFAEFFTAAVAILFGASMGGMVAGTAPDRVKASKAAKRIYNLLDDAQNLHEIPGDSTTPIKGRLEFRDVAFAYPTRPDAPVLKHISFVVEPGQTMAVVGSSGSGKSTVLALAEGFYNPSEGQILLDGEPLKARDMGLVRSHLAYVPQEPQLFSNTVSYNIAYGLEGDVAQEKVEAAAKEANAHGFVSEFGSGYDTQVGQRGIKVSGGQRQRLAIARALIRKDDIKVLLLDEATSALDTHSEQLIHQALDRARKGRTALIVAHRLSTIRNADVICVIQDGEVVEQGTHDELMDKKGAYAALVEAQVYLDANGNVQSEDEDEGAGAGAGVTAQPVSSTHKEDEV